MLPEPSSQALQAAVETPHSANKRARTDTGPSGATPHRKRKAAPEIPASSASDSELDHSEFLLPQEVHRPSAVVSCGRHSQEVEVASRCAATLDSWRQGNPIIFSTRLVAGDEDTPCSSGGDKAHRGIVMQQDT